MDIHESLSSRGFVLNEQIARQIFEVLPEQGPIMLIMETRADNAHHGPGRE